MSPKSNPTVLFIHGLWMHPTTWDPWAQVFNAQGYPHDGAGGVARGGRVDRG